MTKIASTEKVTATKSTPVAPAAPPAVVATMADPAVKECQSLLTQVAQRLGVQTPLSGDDVRRATKMRKGGAEVIPKILALCEQHGITQIGTLTTQEMSAQLNRGDALLQVGLQSAIVEKKVKESAMAAHGRSWQIGTTMYTTLQRLAVDDPELAEGLEPIQSFFQTKKTKGLIRANKKASEAKKQAKDQEVVPTAASEPGVAGAATATHVAAAPVAASPVVAAAAPAAPATSGSAPTGTGTAVTPTAGATAAPTNGAA